MEVEVGRLAPGRGFPEDESEALLMAPSNDSGVISPPDGAEQPSHASASSASAEVPVGSGGGEEDEIDASLQVTSLLQPVSITMAIVVFLVHEMAGASQQVRGGFSELMVYQEDTSDSTSTLVGGVMLNGLVIVAMLFFVTTFLLLLYKYRCYVLIYAWLFFSVSTLLFLFGGYVAQQLLEMHDVPTDAVSFFFVLWNFSAVGTLMVFWTEYGLGPTPPLSLQQAYLVIISALLAWSATKTPEWTTWGLLLAVSIWDLIAVLTPRGPLKLLVEEAEKRGEPIPGLVYQGDDIKLGLGDFVFYSVLVGRASMRGSATLVACAVAVLTGLCATLALLPFLQRVLPALPISIAVGIAFYFTTWLMLTPMAYTSAVSHVFL
jgi:presenilin 1